MPRPSKNTRYTLVHFTWILVTRDGVWWADGRSNKVNAGRHSLGTKDRAEAVNNLTRLDLTIAVGLGLAAADLLAPVRGAEVTLSDGRRLYEDHVARSPITGGARKSSQKRYRAVLDKFLTYLGRTGVTCWNRVTANTVQGYLNHLEQDGYAYGTQYLEGTTVKQVLNFLVEQKRLPAEAKINLKLPKPKGTDTHCWRPDELKAILAFTHERAELRWLYDVVLTLTYTGLRIGELIALRWTDVDFATGMMNLVDESTSRRRTDARTIRTLKGGQGRSFPVHDELKLVLEAIPQKADGLVFHGPLGGRLKADTARTTLIRDVLRPLSSRFPTPAGGVGFADGRLHSFRHFFCSLCASQGIPQQVVMRWLGHQDSKLVAHYFHLHDDEARRQMRRVTLGDAEAEG